MQPHRDTQGVAVVRRQSLDGASAVEFEVSDGDVSLRIQFDTANGEAVLRWMPIALGGPYPGGAAYVEPPVLVLRTDDLSPAREIPLASMRLIGRDGLASLPGQAMPRVPLTVRFGLRRGSHRAALRFTAGDAARRVARECVADLGALDAPDDLPPPRRAPLNEAAVTWVRLDESPAAPAAPPMPATAFSPQRIFAAHLAGGAQALLEHGYCPWQTTHLSPEEHPAPPGARSIGDLLHERGLGFYLESLARAARLTGDAPAARAAAYAARMLEANVVDAPWGGRWWGMVGFRETDNALHAGICCLGLHEAHLLTGSPEPLRAAAEVLESWPYDEAEHAPAEIVDSRGRDPRGTFVYNQRLHLASAMALVGRRLGRADLIRKGDGYIRRVVLPAMTAGGDWPYLRGGQPSPHYTILLLKLLSAVAWEPDWSGDPALRAALASGAQHALDWWSWRQDDRDGGTVLWSDVYASERRPQLALAKAAAMTAVLGFLAARADPAYGGPLLGTLRGVYAERDSGWLARMGPASWLHTSVLAPLLDLPLRGYRFGGDGQTLESLSIALP
jgi:hypothetical protein